MDIQAKVLAVQMGALNSTTAASSNCVQLGKVHTGNRGKLSGRIQKTQVVMTLCSHCGLGVNCLPRAPVFELLILSWWSCF